MNKDEFGTLQIGDAFVHGLMRGEFTVTSLQTDYDYSTNPPTAKTWAVETSDGRYLKRDDADVVRCRLVPQTGDLVVVLESDSPGVTPGQIGILERTKRDKDVFRLTISDFTISRRTAMSAERSPYSHECLVHKSALYPTYTRKEWEYPKTTEEGREVRLCRLFELETFPAKSDYKVVR